MTDCWKLFLARATAVAALAAMPWTLPAYAGNDEPFVVKPYLQMGNPGKDSRDTTEEVMWLCDPAFKEWSVEYKDEAEKDWHTAILEHHPILDAGRDKLEEYKGVLHNLTPGARFQYQVKRKESVQLAASAVAPKQRNQPCKIVIFGDCGFGSSGQKAVANQCYKAQPDLVVIPGDVVYAMGTFSDYQRRFFPVYNADEATEQGVPLLRSTLVMPVVGNHDVADTRGPQTTDMNQFPDGLAFYTLWDLPLNGPGTTYGEVNTLQLSGKKENIDLFLQSAGNRFPRQSMYSFDYGDTHWTVLDGNYYMDYTNAKTRDWVRNDLKKANSKWKIVTFHQPGFSADASHFSEQRMRLLADLFEECGVDVVFSGHAHNYQCSYPLHFQAEKRDGKYVVRGDGRVPGKFTLDTHFDGKKVTKPDGVIYIVTGGGGAPLYSERTKLPEEPDFIKKSVSTVHSFTLCDIKGDTMSIRQISGKGELLDEFTMTKH